MQSQEIEETYTVSSKLYISSDSQHIIKTITSKENNAYVEYTELESMLDYLSSGDKKLKKTIFNDIDKKYYKNFRLSEGERVKRCVDLAGLIKTLRYVDDYEIHKSIIASASGTSYKTFGYEKLIDALKYASGKWKSYNHEIQAVNRHDRLEEDYKHNNIDNKEKHNELTQKEKAELFDEFIMLREARRKAKNEVYLIDQYKIFFEKFHITQKDLDLTITNMKKLHAIFRKGKYNQRTTEAEKEQWKIQLSTKYKLK